MDKNDFEDLRHWIAMFPSHRGRQLRELMKERDGMASKIELSEKNRLALLEKVKEETQMSQHRWAEISERSQTSFCDYAENYKEITKMLRAAVNFANAILEEHSKAVSELCGKANAYDSMVAALAKVYT